MTATDRVQSEKLFHDTQARKRAVHFQFQPESLTFPDDDFLDHETWIRPAMAMLGDLSGKDALDYGCGHGMASVVMARRGARVTSFDLSDDYLSEASRRAAANHVAIRFVQADGHCLPFDDASFDAVWGNAILHHLDLTIAGRELRRVMRPQGVAVFCEPWRDNPILSFARRRLPYPGKARTPDEVPLGDADLSKLSAVFSHVECHGFQLLSMVHRVLPIKPLTGALHRIDGELMRRLPALKKFCRYMVIVLRSG